jgi:protein phosphatase
MTIETPNLRCAALSDVGRVRAKNEDRYYVDAEQQLFVVADGVGSHFAGEVAASAVVEMLPRQLEETARNRKRRLDDKVAQAVVTEVARLSRQLRRETQDEPGLAGMGSTVVLALVREMQALVVHMGDSRAYLFREGQLDQLTHDHTLVALLVQAGKLSPEDAPSHPASGRLARYVGMEGDACPEAQIVDLQPRDQLLLCSDGLSGMIETEVIREILAGNKDPKDACRHLIEAANAAGGKDNITAVLVAV